MKLLRDPHQLDQVSQRVIQAILRQRFHDLCDPEPYDPDEHGFFILVEPGDFPITSLPRTSYALFLPACFRRGLPGL